MSSHQSGPLINCQIIIIIDGEVINLKVPPPPSHKETVRVTSGRSTSDVTIYNIGCSLAAATCRQRGLGGDSKCKFLTSNPSNTRLTVTKTKRAPYTRTKMMIIILYSLCGNCKRECFHRPQLMLVDAATNNTTTVCRSSTNGAAAAASIVTRINQLLLSSSGIW